MNWKSWPHLVKGGVMGLAAATAFIWFNFQDLFQIWCQIGKPCPSAWEMFTSEAYYVPVLLYLVLPSGALGCLIGWLYGKIKNRKSPLAKGADAF